MTNESTKTLVSTQPLRYAPGASRRTALIEQYGQRERFSIVEDAGSFRQLALSEDGNTLAAIAGNTLCLWNTQTLARIERFGFDQSITQIAISADGQGLIVADAANKIHLVDVPFAAVECIGQHTEVITALTLDPLGLKASYADSAGQVAIFDPEDFNGAVLLRCSDPARRLQICLRQDLLAVDSGGALSIYRISTQEKLAQYGEGERLPTADSLEYLPLVSRAPEGVRVYDQGTGQIRCAIALLIPAFDATLDGSTIVTTGGCHITVWDGMRGGQIRNIRTFVNDPTDIKVNSDGSSLYVCGSKSAIEHFSIEGRRLGSYVDLCYPIMAAAMTADNRNLVVADECGALSIYDLVTGCVRQIFPHGCCVSKLFLSGSWAATGGHDGLAKVVDIDTGSELFSVSCSGKSVQAVSLDPDGLLVTGNLLGMVQLHDMSSGEIVREYHGNDCSIRCLSISPCKRYLLSTSEHGDVLVFDYRNGRLLNRLHERALVYSGCFDESGDFIYVGNGGGNIVKFRPLAAQATKRWRIHSSEVRSISISHGKLCSIGINDDAHILDLATGETLLACPVTTKPFHRVAFLSDDGSRLVTGGQDGQLMIRDSKDGSIVAEMHNLGKGFLWATRGNTANGEGSHWFWTDREELIQVYSRVGGIETLLRPCERQHQAFMAAGNNQVGTMSRVGLCAQARSLHTDELLGADSAVPSNYRIPPLLTFERGGEMG